MTESKTATLPRTKFFRPVLRDSHIGRPRLVQQINQAREKKLVLITAPAGFGKTVLLAQWIDQTNVSVVWLSVESTDSDLKSFLTYLLTALRQVIPEMTVKLPHDLGRTKGNAARSLLAELINNLVDWSQSLTIVMDDFHNIDNPEIANALDYLLDHAPPNLNFILASRTISFLRFSQLRVGGNMVELDENDLRLSHEETKAFLANMVEEPLPEEDIAILEQRTEGWVAAMQMVALTLNRVEDMHSYVKSFSGSDRLITDYLMDEVLSRQPPDIQDFMLRTAVLNNLSAELCSHLLGINDAQDKLNDLESARLFLFPLDHNRSWYRYHHLFRDLLLLRLRRNFAHEEFELHRRAADWYQENGFRERAIDHAIQAQDFDLAIHLLEKIADELQRRGEFQLFIRWMKKIPEKLTLEHPTMLLYHAIALFEAGYRDEAYDKLEYAFSEVPVLSNSHGELDEIDHSVVGVAYTFRGVFLADRDEAQLAKQMATKALQHLNDYQRHWQGLAWMVNGQANRVQTDFRTAISCFEKASTLSIESQNLFWAAASLSATAKLYADLGEISKAGAICQQALHLLGDYEEDLPIAGLASILLGMLSYTQGKITEATDQLYHGVDLVQLDGDVNYLLRGYFHISLTHLADGNLEGAIASLHRGEKIIKKFTLLSSDSLPLYPSPMDLGILAACYVRIYLYGRRPDLAKPWIGEIMAAARRQYSTFLDPADPFRSSPPIYKLVHDPIRYSQEFLWIALARYALETGDPAEALSILDGLLPRVQNEFRTARLVEIRMLMARCQASKDHLDEAKAQMLTAIRLAQPIGLVQLFIDEGSRVYEVLEETLSLIDDDGQEQFAMSLLDAIRQRMAIRQKRGALNPISLTPREIEVMKWLARGYSYSEIATRLEISENTLRTHIKRIYSKFSVNNRVQAVNVARENNIIPSLRYSHT